MNTGRSAERMTFSAVSLNTLWSRARWKLLPITMTSAFDCSASRGMAVAGLPAIRAAVVR